MSTQNAPRHTGLLTVLDGLLSVAVLALAGCFVEFFYTSIGKGGFAGKWSLAALMFLGMAISQGIRAYLARSGHRLDVLLHGVCAVIFLVCAGLILLSRQNAADAVLDAYVRDIHFKVVTWLYEASLIFGRLLAMLRDRTRRGAYINIALIVVIVILMWQMEMVSMILFIAWQCVAYVGTIAFARIDIPTLKKIVRKTYAAEILFGIVLLIVAFSLVLPYLEEGIATFPDALWYCFAIVTTIGFGDFSAVTPLGRILSVILGLYGIIVVALITSIVVNFYGEMKAVDDD